MGGNTVGTLTDASLVTDIYVGETYCLQHVVPALPSGVRLTAHSLFSNGTEVPMVPAYQGADAYNNFTAGVPTYGSIVQFYYTVSSILLLAALAVAVQLTRQRAACVTAAARSSWTAA